MKTQLYKTSAFDRPYYAVVQLKSRITRRHIGAATGKQRPTRNGTYVLDKRSTTQPINPSVPRANHAFLVKPHRYESTLL